MKCTCRVVGLIKEFIINILRQWKCIILATCLLAFILIYFKYHMVSPFRLRPTVKSQQDDNKKQSSSVLKFEVTPSTFYYNNQVNYSRYPTTNLKLAWTLTGQGFFQSIHPPFNCSRFQTRVGKKKGDGGKWTCGLQVLGGHTKKQSYPCVVYSFGVATESAFEAQVLQQTKCNVYAYDPTVKQMGKQVLMDAANQKRIFFKPYAIGYLDRPDKREVSLKTLMAMNNHSWIDILKVDVEAAEYEVFAKIFQDFERLPFGQLLIEMHVWWKEWPTWRWLTYTISELERKGMRMFYREINSVVPTMASEFSFVNLHALDLFMH